MQAIECLLGHLVLGNKGYRANLQSVPGHDNLPPADPPAVDKGAVDAVEIFNVQAAGVHADQAVPPTNVGRRNAQITVLATANDGFFALKLQDARAATAILDDQLNI